MTHPPGAVIVICQEQARWHRFTMALADLELPKGSRRVFGIGCSIVENLNYALRLMRPEDEWVWIVGDDHIFETTTVMRLLDRGADMIAPLCVRREPPFGLVHYEDNPIASSPFYRPVQIDEIPDEPFEVEVTGSAPLIRREVLDALGDPWYRVAPTQQNEEVDFCTRAREAGFSIMVDPDVTIGHIGQMVVYPQKRNGTWGLVLDFFGTGRNQIFMPGGIKDGHLGDLEPKGELAHA